MWAENNIERMQYRLPLISIERYITENKFWLKRTFLNENNVKKS